MRHIFFKDKTTNGAGDQLSVVGEAGKLLLSGGGTFDGATVTITVETHYSGVITPVDAAFTAAFAYTLEVPGRAVVKATISSAGGSTSLSCEASN